MRIKKFTASNYSIALQKVKQELGEEALILSTRSIKSPSPIAGRKEATRVEITVAVEYASPVVAPEIQIPNELENKAENADLKSLIFSLLSQTDRAQAMGLKPHQFDTFSHLVESGLDEKLASKILKKALEQNSEQTADSSKRPLKVMDLMQKN